MKIQLFKAKTATKAAKSPKPASLPAWPRYKGLIAWLAITGCVCIGIIIAFQWLDIQLGTTLAILVAIASVLLKLASPHLRARSVERRIATIKAKQGSARVPGPRPSDRLITDPIANRVDVGQLEAKDSFALMHMGPPEIIDLDLTRPHAKRGKVVSDVAALEGQKNLAVEKAIELEDIGAIDKAIVQYAKALALARQLGRDDEAISFENRIAQLKQEMGK